MTNYEDFFAFGYQALLIASGLLISIIPGYLAYWRNKSFWRWWLFTSTTFTILTLIVIQAQNFSLLIYSLAVLPIASIAAVLPESEYMRIAVPISSYLKERAKSNRFRDLSLFFFGLIVMVAIGAMLFYHLLSGTGYWQYPDKSYIVTLTVVFLLACLGLASFIFVVSRIRILHITASALLTFLLALPFFLQPSRAYALLRIQNAVTRIDFLLGSVITDLIDKPVAGVFVLMGICSGCSAIAILLNDRYGIAGFLVATTQKNLRNAPSIHFSKNPFLSSRVLAGFIIFVLFIVNFELGEGWIFLVPLIYLCWVFPLLLVSFAGLVLSSLVIAKSINQGKSLYAVGIFICGLLAIWRGAGMHFFIGWLGIPGTLLMSYGMASGFIAIILWVISDISGSRPNENL